MTAQAKTPNLNGVTAPNVQTEGNATDNRTKETIHLKNTSSTSTATLTAPTPKIRAYLEANPGWADEPFSRLFVAGFSFEEFACLTNLAKVQHRAAEASPVNPRVQEWLDAIPDVQRLPVTDVLKAGFTKEERNYAVDYLVAAVRKVMN